MSPCARFGLQAIDEINCIEEAATQTGTDAASRDGNGQMRLASPGAPDENDVALARDEAASGQIAQQGFVDGRAVEVKIIDVLGQREFGDGHLIFDGARLLFGDFGLKKIADDLRRLVLALYANRHHVIIGAPHAEELEFAHEVEDLRAFHQPELLS